MKLYLKYLLSISLLYALSACTNNDTKQAVKQDADSIAATIAPHDPVSKEMASGKQFKEDVVKEDEQATGPVAAIRDEYQRIQQLLHGGKLQKEATEFKCNNDPGSGHLVRYFEGKQLVLMDYQMNSEHWWKKKRVYLEAEEPIFIFEQEGSWMFGGPPSNKEYQNTIDKIEERRYYLNDGVLIRQLNKEFEDKTWEEKVTSDMVPNHTVELKSDAKYPHATEVAKMKKGIASC